MFEAFLVELKERKIDYILLNGYEDIAANINDSDIDILLKRKDFLIINKLLKEICKSKDWRIIQVFHHDIYAKNIFLYNNHSQEILNLDIYGSLSRLQVPLFTEKELFYKVMSYNGFKVLNKGHEFVYYLIKKLDKNELTQEKFQYLKEIFSSDQEQCIALTKKYFSQTHSIIENSFQSGNKELINRKKILEDFSKKRSLALKCNIKNFVRFLKRIIKPTGLVMAFLGSDGSGKSTIIEIIKSSNLPFRRFEYFHLKPIKSKQSSDPVSNPHEKPVYSSSKSYLKLLYLVVQYNLGWIKNIIALKIKSTLVVFDRYYDDLLVDPKRFRYGGKISIAKWVKSFFPQPDIVFVLTTSPKIIYKRKQEVEMNELTRQIEEYNSLSNSKNYYLIDVDNAPKEIASEVIKVLANRLSSRYF